MNFTDAELDRTLWMLNDPYRHQWAGAMIGGACNEAADAIAQLRKERRPREPTPAMLEAGFGPFLGAHDPMFSMNEPCGPIWKIMWDAAAPEERKDG